jgi:cytochrome c
VAPKPTRAKTCSRKRVHRLPRDRQEAGRSFLREVAAKYKGDAGAAAKLADKVKKGGSGVWGQVPMPPNPQVSDADLKTMIAYILAAKK